MEKVTIKRVFELKRKGATVKLTDPDESLPPAKVAVFYSNSYPELLNASVQGPTINENGEAVYTFGATVGTKG